MGSKDHGYNRNASEPVFSTQSSPDQLLATKFIVPTPFHTLIARPRLIAMLNEGLKKNLILVSAATGFGKTSLLSTWVHAFTPDDPQVAWITLDAYDNTPNQFWTYVIAELEQHWPEIAPLPSTFLPEESQLAGQSMITALINNMARRSERVLLVLDNYNEITEPTIHALISYLVEHLPPTLCVVLSTRTNPPFSLARLRVRAQIQELRTAQLRYTQEEAQAFLREVMNIPFSEQDIQKIQKRTQGWWAGLQMAALALKGRSTPMDLRHELHGSQKTILEYLIHEVLQRQPDRIQIFLLRTSILERFCPSLCDALLEQQESRSILEELEHANLFLNQIDREHHWYAYNPLFAEALRYQLAQTFPDEVPTLHLRASQWYAAQQCDNEAIQHALYAQAWSWAAELIEHIPSQHIWSRLKAPFWIEQLPSDVVRARPRLCLAYAQALFWDTPHSITKGWLSNARTAWAALHVRKENATVAILEQEVPVRILGEIAALQAVIAGLYDGDAGATRAYGNEALTYLVEQQQAAHSQVVFAQSLADLSLGNLERAIQTMQTGSMLALANEDTAIATICLSRAGWDITMLGRLQKAWRFTQHVIHQAQTLDEHPPATVCWLYTRQAEILREWDRLEEARNMLEKAIQIGEQAEISSFLALEYTILMKIALSQGALAEAATANQLMEDSWKRMPSAYRYALYSSVPQVRFWLACGDLEQARHWKKKLEQEEPLVSPLARERQTVAIARIALTEHQPDKALALLEPLVTRAIATERWGHVLEMWLLQTQAYHMLQQQEEALAILAQAIHLAAPEGYIRLFVDEGAPIADLLERLRKQENMKGLTSYLDTLLSAFHSAHETQPIQQEHLSTPIQPPLDPLSPREHEMLQLVARGASNKEIAETLVISLNTVKHHMSTILSKLEVTNRTQAATRARTLGLLSSTTDTADAT